MSCCAASAELTPTPSPASALDQEYNERAICAASVQLEPDCYQFDLVVPDIRCVSCITTIETALLALPQVDYARANVTGRRVTIRWRPSLGPARGIMKELANLGYTHHLQQRSSLPADRFDQVGRRLLIALGIAGFAAANIMLLSVSVWSGADQHTAQIFNIISGLIAVPAVMVSGQPFFRPAITALRHRRMTMDLPISLAVLIALGSGVYQTTIGGTEVYFDAAVTLLFFLLIGRYLDHVMRQRANSAAQNLAQLAPKAARQLMPDGSIDYIALEDIAVGMRLQLPMGERAPVDSRLISPAAEFDRSLVTGESTPVDLIDGDQIEAGVLNIGRPVEIEVERDAQHSYLAEVEQLMAGAEATRNRYVQIADRLAQIYAPAVHALAALTGIGWLLFTGLDWVLALNTATAVLIITCPCALGLAAPVVHVIAAGQLFKRGILIKDGSGLERLAEVNTVVFDKTGTLTSGRPRATLVGNLGEGQRSVLRAVAAHSGHPAARAISQWAEDGVRAHLTEIVETAGFGLEARWNGDRIRLGRPAWVHKLTASQPVPGAGMSFSIDGHQTVDFNLADSLRPDAATTVAQLKRTGMAIAMMTGDRHDAAQTVAATLGIDDVHADMNPTQKLAAIEARQQNGEKVLMIGDGLNDGPALAAGHASMAPSTGSDIGRQAADFILTAPSLSAVTDAVQIAQRANRLVRQNFALAITYNCVAIPCAAAGLVSPLIAALAMSASSLLVIANSFRLARPVRDGTTDAVPRRPMSIRPFRKELHS